MTEDRSQPSHPADVAGDDGEEQTGWAKGIIVSALIAAIGLAVAWAGGQGGAMLGPVPVMVAAAAAAFVIQWLVFVPSYRAQTEHYFDLTGSLTYQALTWGTLIASFTFAPRQLLIAALVAIWSARLGLFLFRRVRQDGKDGRFDAIKPDGGRFLVVWSIQGLWVTLTMAAALSVLGLSRSAGPNIVDVVGLGVWIIGFMIEAVADQQKRVHKREQGNRDGDDKGSFISTGLWSWSRHPNYFGEIVLWVGVAIIASSDLDGWRYVTLISPVFVALLLIKISGIPMLEARADKRWGGQDDYEAYKSRTSVLVPLPPGD